MNVFDTLNGNCFDRCVTLYCKLILQRTVLVHLNHYKLSFLLFSTSRHLNFFLYVFTVQIYRCN
jgi:hypothetical protein